MFRLPPGPKSSALARSTGRAATAISAVVRAAGSKARGAAGTGLAALKNQNSLLRERLREASPADASKMVLSHLPAMGTNYALSVADETEGAATIEAFTKLKPSSLAFGVAMATLVALPKRHRRFRDAAAKFAVGAGHAVMSRLGRRTPAAIKAGRAAAMRPATSGTGDVPPVPGERTDA